METAASVLLSLALALAWARGQALGSAVLEGHGSLDSPLPLWAWRLVMRLRAANQVLPAILAAAAAASTWGMLYAACTLGVMAHLEEEPRGWSDWLGDAQLSLPRRWALLAGICIWRAEKMENLLQRTQRSVAAIKAVGLSTAIQYAARDPGGWVRPALWGIARRLALVAVSCCGCSAFALVAFPAVALDECLWWLLAWLQNAFSKWGLNLPAAFDVVVLPLLDQLHFLPVLSRVFLLAVLEYPELDAPRSTQVLLVVSALAWTAHNCHTLYTAICVDIPESARQICAASR